MEPELPAHLEGPVTTTVTRRVKPGHEAAYEAFRPAPGQGGEYRTVYRYDSAAHLQAWMDSPERAAWLERAEPHVAGPMRTQILTGLESWSPCHPARGPAAVLQDGPGHLATIFPLVAMVVVASSPLLGSLPLVVRLAVTTGVTVPLMTWVVMPRVTRLLGRWLYPDRRR